MKKKTETTATEVVSEKMAEKPAAKKSAFKEMLKTLHVMDGYVGKAVDVIYGSAKIAGRAVCYTMIVAAGISLAAVAVGAAVSPGETKKIAKGEMVLIEKSRLQEKDHKINLLENEGTLHRAVRKFQGRPLE